MLNSIQKDELWKQFKDAGANGLAMNHYELARHTKIKDVELWKAFLLEQDVRNYIATEIEIVRVAEYNKMIQNVGDNNRSVGQAQLMSALDKLKKDNTTKDGPVFIYSYVPLSSEQTQAENANELEEDPFWLRR